MQFSDFKLDPRLHAGIQHTGFQQPTPIQAAALPLALAGHDILGSAETGTGKTAAFVLPILERLLGAHVKQPRALVLVPTRELALQVAEQARQLGALTPLRVSTVYGGVALLQQERELRRGVDVVVATPVRLLDHIERRNVTFSALEVLVIDEADR